jgi:hypothetical protein
VRVAQPVSGAIRTKTLRVVGRFEAAFRSGTCVAIAVFVTNEANNSKSVTHSLSQSLRKITEKKVMSSIRILSLALGVVLSLSSVACIAAAPADQNGNGQQSGSGFNLPTKGSSSSGSTTQGNAAGTCDGVCTHVIACMGQEDTAETHTACMNKCTSMNATAAQLAEVEQASCEEINKNIPAPSTSSSSSGSSGSTKSKECDGCVSDGSGGCYWGSQGNWGSSGYSGAVAECSASCCE